MKFLHLADLHLGKRVNGFSMLEDQAHILRQQPHVHWPELVVQRTF